MKTKVYSLASYINQAEALESMQLIVDQLTEHVGRNHLLRIYVSNPEKLKVLSAMEGNRIASGISIKTDDCRKLNAIVAAAEQYNSFYYYNKSGGKIPHAGYSMQLIPQQNTLGFKIQLPYAEGIACMKSCLEELLRYLADQHLLRMVEREFMLVCNSLIDLSSAGLDGTWSYKSHFVELSAWADVQPRINGVLEHSRTTGINIRFDSEGAEKPSVIGTLSQQINNLMYDFLLEKSGCSVSGFINITNPFELIPLLEENEIACNVWISIDLDKNPDCNLDSFAAEELEQQIHQEVKQFQWKLGPSGEKNCISLFSNDRKMFNYEISIEEEMADEVIAQIIELTGLDFVFQYSEYDD